MKGKYGNGNRTQRITIRNMEIDDIPSVYHLGERLFTSDEMPILYRTWDPYEVTDAFTLDADYCFVAEIEGKVAGFLLGTTMEKEGTAWKKYGYVTWIAVDEDFQRSHLAQRLYYRLERELQEGGVRMILADTSQVNHDALAFFKYNGFSLRGNHLWMTKTLPKMSSKKVDK